MIGDLLVTLYIGNSVKDLEQEVDIPTVEETLCVVETPIYTVQYCPVL